MMPNFWPIYSFRRCLSAGKTEEKNLIRICSERFLRQKQPIDLLYKRVRLLRKYFYHNLCTRQPIRGRRSIHARPDQTIQQNEVLREKELFRILMLYDRSCSTLTI